MRTRLRCLGLASVLLAVFARDGGAQGYRIRIDTRAQAVSYRGVLLDSVPIADTVTGATGGTTTSSGFEATCTPGVAYCTFFQPGPEEHANPLTSTADLTLFGLGVRGLSVRTSARLGTALGGDPWPGTDPPTQLLEGYAQYARRYLTLQVGRQTVTSRLGFSTFDGGRVTVRAPSRGLELTAYGGWGVWNGSILPVTSAALNPLGDYRPPERTITAGAGAAWTTRLLDLHWSYEREVDPSVDYFVSERTGIEGLLHVSRGLSLSGGADYDLAEGWWGSAEATLAYTTPNGRINGSAGIRRYRPHFDLWTIWGAFAPVPYTAYDGSLTVSPTRRLQLHVDGEHYAYATANAESPLVTVDTTGWRFSWDATYTVTRRWSVDGGYRAEFGPGASSRGFQGSVTYAAGDRVALGIQGATLDRPLEFRYDESSTQMFGVFAHCQPSSRLRVELDASRYSENRQRPDPAAFDWDQLRVSARVVLMFSSGELAGLPPAVRRMPAGPEGDP